VARGSEQLLPLFGGNACCGTAEIAAGPQPYFCEHQRITIPKNKIYFAEAATVVSFEQLKTLLLQKYRGNAFCCYAVSVSVHLAQRLDPDKISQG